MNCVRAVIREMQRRFELGRSCDHNAMFALAYLRTTQTYLWAAQQPGFFQDTPWVNHEDAVFAKYYFNAYDNWLAGNWSQVPQAWLIAFDSAKDRRTTGSGDLLLGMSAHINRDLPFTLAAIGMVTGGGEPQGRPRQGGRVPQHGDQAHAGRAGGAVRPGHGQHRDSVRGRPRRAVPAGRGMAEKAWRNAELLVSAPTPQLRAAVAEQIEPAAPPRRPPSWPLTATCRH